jgi:hypothetical protein
MSFTPAEKIYLKAATYNWDNGLARLQAFLENKAADKATALLIYWRCDPNFYYRYDSEKEIPSWAKAAYELMKKAEKIILENFSAADYVGEISYSPDADRLPKTAEIAAKIPKEMFLPAQGATDGETLVRQYYFDSALIEACRKGDIAHATALLSKCAGIMDICIDGRSPISVALEKTKMLEFLLENGANPNKKIDDLDMLPLHAAALIGKKPAIKALLKYGANIDAQTPEGLKTAAHIVINIADNANYWTSFKLANTLKLLLKSGANLEIKDKEGQTAQALAATKKNKDLATIIATFIQK